MRGSEDETVVLPAVTGPPSPTPRARHRRPDPTAGDRVRAALGVTGEVLITLGLVVLLFVVYEV